MIFGACEHISYLNAHNLLEATFNKRAYDDFRHNSTMTKLIHAEQIKWQETHTSISCLVFQVYFSYALSGNTQRRNIRTVHSQNTHLFWHVKNETSFVIRKIIRSVYVYNMWWWYTRIQHNANDSVLAFHFKLHAILTIFM